MIIVHGANDGHTDQFNLGIQAGFFGKPRQGLKIMFIETGGIEAVLESVGVVGLTAAPPLGAGCDLDRRITAGAGVVTGLPAA